MNLMRRVRDDERDEQRFQASLHGAELVDAPVARATGLRGFHERLKRKLGSTR